MERTVARDLNREKNRENLDLADDLHKRTTSLEKRNRHLRGLTLPAGRNGFDVLRGSVAPDKEECAAERRATRTCARCGCEFLGTPSYGQGSHYTCPACRKPERPGCAADVKLTCREWQVIHLVKKGESNKSIAYALCLSEGTIKEYLSHIFTKLNLRYRNRTELAMWAVSQGQDPPGDSDPDAATELQHRIA